MRNAESGRWYSPETKLCVTEITGKNGKVRKPNIADAVKLGLLPSVTSVQAVMAKPALVRWMQGQAIMAALTLPKVAGESDEAYIDRILDDAEALKEAACETGKDFHTAAEGYWKAGIVKHDDPAIQMFLAGLVAWRISMDARYPGLTWYAECPYINDALGIAGTPDIVGIGADVIIVGDYKTMDLSKVKGCPKPYDSHGMQMACGLTTLEPAKTVRLGVNLFVDRVTGEIRCYEWTDDEISEYWAMFKTVVQLWKQVNKWDKRMAK